jgi:hypothetical protein
LAKLKKEIEVVVEEPIVEEVKTEQEIISEISELVAEVTLQETEPVVITEPVDTLISKTVDSITKVAETTSVFAVPPVDKTPPNYKALQNKLEYLEKWIYKISAEGAGSGEVNLRWLDDVKRETIADGRWLKYSEIDKKFVFDEINPYEVVYNTTEVTTATYTVGDNDYYIGVNYAGPVTITLPSSTNSGRMLIIKDEDGDAETNPITVLGTVDNDAGGFIIQINNGAIQLIYRNGWRIV